MRPIADLTGGISVRPYTAFQPKREQQMVYTLYEGSYVHCKTLESYNPCNGASAAISNSYLYTKRQVLRRK